MKKFLFFIICMAFMQQAMAQGKWTFTPSAGINFSNLYGDEYESKTRIGLNIGIESQYRLSSKFGLSAGLRYTEYGCRRNDDSKTLAYLAMPVLGNLNLWKGLTIKCGLQPDLLISNNLISHHSNKADLDIPIGISYEYQHIVFDIRYNLGLLRVDKTYPGNDLRNRNLGILIGYCF